MKKLIIGALLVLLLGVWYVGTCDRHVLVVSSRACPCELEAFTEKAWDSVCTVPPYIPSDTYRERGGNRQPVTLDQECTYDEFFHAAPMTSFYETCGHDNGRA